jgi:hypothetical protein
MQKKPVPPVYKYCSNCSQPVPQHLVDVAADPNVKFCPWCDGRLDAEGRCTSEGCPYCGLKPPV